MIDRRRLERLEARSRMKSRPRDCGTCGHPLPVTLPPRGVTAGFNEPAGPETCPACGRRLVFRIQFDDAG